MVKPSSKKTRKPEEREDVDDSFIPAEEQDESESGLIDEVEDETSGLIDELIAPPQHDDDNSSSSGDDDDDVEANERNTNSDQSYVSGDEVDTNDENDVGDHHSSPKKIKKIHKLSMEQTEDFNAKLRKRGVLYIARVPPRMNPTKIKSLLTAFGTTVTRVYLVEEDKSVQKLRQKNSSSGNSGGKRYVEGWVEFEDKRVAKKIGQSLNNTPISNHKRNVHFGDLWSVKYLHKFQWSHLTEKVAYERRVREQKLKVEMMQVRRENASYSQLVEAGKKIDKIEERKRKRGEGAVTMDPERKRSFRQTKPVEERTSKAGKRAVLSGLL